MNTIAEFRDFIDGYDDDSPLLFVLCHPDDKKALDRSLENNIYILPQHPVLKLVVDGAGHNKDLDTGEIAAAIFLRVQ